MPHKDRQAYLEYHRAYHAKNGRSKRLKKTFGISLEVYQEMLVSQHGVCAICFKPETAIHGSNGKVQNLSVDHNHETGQIRGLLCSKCNTALGLLDEDLSRAQSLIRYVESYAKMGTKAAG